MGLHSHRRLAVSRRTDSASTTCLVMSGNGLKIAGTTTIRVHRLTAVPGKTGIAVGALCAAVPIALFRRSFVRPSASGPNRRLGITAAGSAWPEQLNDGVVSSLFFPNNSKNDCGRFALY